MHGIKQTDSSISNSSNVLARIHRYCSFDWLKKRDSMHSPVCTLYTANGLPFHHPRKFPSSSSEAPELPDNKFVCISESKPNRLASSKCLHANCVSSVYRMLPMDVFSLIIIINKWVYECLSPAANVGIAIAVAVAVAVINFYFTVV